jgi:hypothetical protein
MMDALIRQLARERQIEAQYKTERDALRAEMEAEYKERLDRVNSLLDTAREDVALTEIRIRRDAVSAFKRDSIKRPHSAVQIKEYTILGYDPDQAFAYCVEHLTTALKMDKRKFEKVARAAELDFVTISTEPRASIARDLSAYTEEAQ